jgi:Holliday junction resolvasome RuvABC endonuclease subunit
MVIAFDFALTTGWCVMSFTGPVIDSGTWDFRPHRNAVGRHNGHMFMVLDDLISGLVQELPGFRDEFPVIVWERAHHRGGPATRLGVGWITVAQMVAARFSCPIADVTSGALKKFATGDTKAGKDAMIDFARPILGRDPIDDNEADAVAVARWYLERRTRDNGEFTH